MYIQESVASARIERYAPKGRTFRLRKADAAQTCRYGGGHWWEPETRFATAAEPGNRIRSAYGSQELRQEGADRLQKGGGYASRVGVQGDLRQAEHRLQEQPKLADFLSYLRRMVRTCTLDHLLLGWPFLRIEYAILTVTRYTPHVSISGSGPAPGKGGKAAGAENEQF